MSNRSCLVAGIAGSNPTAGIHVCLLCLYVAFWVGRGLCDGLIIRPGESYCVSNCVIKKPQHRGGQGSNMSYSAIRQQYM
jgi:hypothetical protein